MSPEHLWLVILIIVVIIVIVILVYKNIGNVSPPQTISSQPLALTAPNQGGALTAAPYVTGNTVAVAGYTDYAIIKPSTTLPNQFFNFVPQGKASQIVIQKTTDGLYLQMRQTVVYNPGQGGATPTQSTTIWVGSFLATSPDSASLFQITRNNNANNYTLLHLDTGLYAMVTSTPFILRSLGGAIPVFLFSLGSTATNFSLSSTGM